MPTGAVVDEVRDDDRPRSVAPSHRRIGAPRLITPAGAVVFVGHVPHAGFLHGTVETDKGRLIRTGAGKLMNVAGKCRRGAAAAPRLTIG